MKKLLFIALAAMMMTGCNDTTENIHAPYGGNRATNPFTTVIIDSCEYISGGTYKLAHKGNCRFCTERRKQELKELVIKLKEK